MTRTIILVEPICRGSRLQILANTLTALQRFANVVLITRRNYCNQHFDELISSAGLCPRIITIDSDLGDAWMRNLSVSEFDQIIARLNALEAELSSNGNYDVVFMALDDYLAAYSLAGFKLRRQLRHAAITCIKYRVEYLFALNKTSPFRSLILRLFTRWALWSSHARLVAFDERLTKTQSAWLGAVLPDPWFGSFSPECRAAGRALIRAESDDFILLTLGKQDRRKGIDFLVNAFPKCSGDRNLKLVVVGAIAAEFADAFELLKGSTDRVLHINEFVPESDLPCYFAAADAFLLPYSREFTATSGTLARAAASGVPALASSHGLIGYRVRAYDLGETFDFGNSTSFVEAVLALRAATATGRARRQAATMRFAQTCALPEFEKSLRLALAI